MLSLLVLLSSYMYGKSVTDRIYNNIVSDMVDIQMAKEFGEDYFEGDSKGQYEREVELYRNIENKYKNHMPAADFDSLIEKIKIQNEKEMEGIDDPHVFGRYGYSLRDVIEVDNHYKYNISEDVFSVGLGFVVTILMVSILLTSGERLTGYYKFTRMFPWSKDTTYAGTQLLGILLTTVLFILTGIIKYLAVQNSNISNIIAFENLWQSAVLYYLVAVFTSIIFVAVGSVTGNFIGHAGTSFVAFMLYDLTYYNIYEWFNLLGTKNYLSQLDKAVRSIEPVLGGIITPVEVFAYRVNEGLSQWLIGFGIFAAILFVIGWYWNRSSKTERSGMMIMRPILSRIVQAYATFTTAAMITEMFGFWVHGGIMPIIMYLVSLLIAAIFYNKIFSIQIGI